MMELTRRIGRCFMLGFVGAEVHSTSPVIQAIREFSLGGCILFDKHMAGRSSENNIVSAGQTARLIADLQDAAGGHLVVAVDQEGGAVSRFSAARGFAVTAPAGVLGQNSGTEATRQAAGQTADLLAQLGFTLNLAPVVDLDLSADNPIIGRYQRSFSADPLQVVEHAATWIEAHHQRGLRCCLKHFPGHGSSLTDSHLGVADITESWQRDELSPYRLLIEGGLADAVMIGHLMHRGLDPHYPATLSEDVIGGLLRGELGFLGPVLSDDMQMRAIADHWGIEEACRMALAAGVDMIILGNNLSSDEQLFGRCVQAVYQAVESGQLPEQRVDEAGRRIQTLNGRKG